MYLVYLDDQIIHSPYPRTTKLSSGVITQRQVTHSFKFEANRKNPAWHDLKPFKSVIRVVNTRTGEETFNGRAIVPMQSMDAGGALRTLYVAEDRTAYLNDSIQTNYYHYGNDVRGFFGRIINTHNAMMPNSPQKHFKVGNVTVTDPNQDMKKYINDGDKTMDVIKKQLIDQLGGYIMLRDEPDGLYIDYLETVGRVSGTRLMFRRNLKTMSREIDPSEVKTVIVPYGAELELPDDATDETVKEMGTKRVSIASVNGGDIRLINEDLVEEFGEHVHKIIFEDVEDPATLKQKGIEYRDAQDAAMINYKITPLDLSLKEGEEYELFEEIELYNWYEIYMPLFNSYEMLQIVQRDIDIINFTSSDVQAGSQTKKLSDYRSMMKKESAKVEDRITYQSRIQRLANRKIKKITDDLTQQQEDMKQVQSDMLGVQGDLVEFKTDLTGAIGDIGNLSTQLDRVSTMFADLNQAQTGIKPRMNGLEQSRNIHNSAIYDINNGILARLSRLESR